MPANIDGTWDGLQGWPLVGIHAVVTQDGKLLTFGTDSRGMQSGQFIYDVYDPATGTHYTLANATPTDIFCSAAIIIPGTNEILIGGGDSRGLGTGQVNTGVDDVNIFNSSDLSLRPYELGTMNFQRWYPTMVSLPSGQIVILGGTNVNGQGMAVPEIFTPGEGWRKLPGATDTDLAAASLYSRAWVSHSGEIIYFAAGTGNTGAIEVRSLDPSGDGHLATLGTLPFNTAGDSPAIMYESGKVLIQAADTGMWIMDITGNTPVFTRTTSLSQERNWSDMTVLADGKVLINGGTGSGNLEAAADRTAAIWDPATGQITYGADEVQARLYHSTSVLLPDGTVISMGGGAGGGGTTYVDAQVYRPPYLYDSNGNVAERPVVTAAPQSAVPGETFTITVDDASSIARITLVKNGATTHSFNMEARMVDLDFTQGPGNTLNVTLPENPYEVSAGSWMLFVWNDAGVPAVAPIIAIEPTISLFDGIGDMTASYFTIDPAVTSLDQIDFTATPDHVERVFEVNETGTGAFYPGGPIDDFAVRYSAPFTATQDGNYTFYLTSDDGSRLFVDGAMVIDNNAMQAATLKTVTLSLQAGTHQLDLLYFEGGGQGDIDLDWSGPGFDREQMLFDGTERNLLVNGSFEAADIPAGTHTLLNSIGGWTSTNRFELWPDGFLGMPTIHGNTLTEVDGQNGALSQSVEMEEGAVYSLSFEVAGRPDYIASSVIEVLLNGTVVATITPENSNWERYTIDITGAGGTDTITFRSPTSDTDGFGGLLDAVVLVKTADAPADGFYDDPAQNQYVTGTEGTDSFVINGIASDYGWGLTEDQAGVVVWKGAGFDILYDIENLVFNNTTVDISALVNPPSSGNIINDIAGVTQFVDGPTAEDSFAINDVSTNYGWGLTQDQQGIVVWSGSNFDILTNVETLRFTDRSVDLTTFFDGGGGNDVSVADIANQTQYLQGTSGTDIFVIDGTSTDYQWARTADDQDHVVWGPTGFDLLYDWEQIRFNDTVIDLV